MKLIPGICLQPLRQSDSQIFSSQEKKAVRKYGEGMINHMEGIHSSSNVSFVKKRPIIQSPAYVESVIRYFGVALTLVFSPKAWFKCQTFYKETFFAPVLIFTPKIGKWGDVILYWCKN